MRYPQSAKKSGFFELADGGTIFLDEIGDMGLKAQAKVLRIIQSGELVRVGSEKIKNVDVRIIAATNKDLKQQETRNEKHSGVETDKQRKSTREGF